MATFTSYGACGYKYFARSVLRLNTVEEPDEREMMDAAERGLNARGAIGRGRGHDDANRHVGDHRPATVARVGEVRDAIAPRIGDINEPPARTGVDEPRRGVGRGRGPPEERERQDNERESTHRPNSGVPRHESVLSGNRTGRKPDHLP